jgi:serine/threonine protein kinase
MSLALRYLGSQLDCRYRLERLLGEGASGWVFAAHDARLDRPVAVKIWKTSAMTPGASTRRFVEEGRLLARLMHPHVVGVYDAGESPDGLAYLVMELSDGGTLEQELASRGRLPAAEALALLLPVVGALATAHDLGVIHRDIKPANIVLARHHGESRAKVLDFGIARECSAHSSSGVLGTPSYMSPEQARGDALTPATDVWSIGVVLFQVLSGGLPFQASTTTGLLLKLTQERAPRFAEVCPGLSPRLAQRLDQALEPRAGYRYGSMRAFARALAQASVLDGVLVPRTPDPLGLPEFEHWLNSAREEDTRPLSPQELSAVAAGTAATEKARRWHPGRSAVALGACAVALAVAGLQGVSSSRAGSTNQRGSRDANPAPAAAQASSGALAPTYPALAPFGVMSPAPALVTSAPVPELAAPKVTPRPRPRAAAFPKRNATAAPQPTPSAAPLPAAPAGPIITSWDW